MDQDILLQRWSHCLACHHSFESVAYRCLQCSDLLPSYYQSGSGKSKNSFDTSESSFRRDSSYSSPFSPSSGLSSTGSQSQANSSDQDGIGPFNVCHNCVQKSFLFHPSRHVFVRIEIGEIQKFTNTTNSTLWSSGDYAKHFDAPDNSKNLQTICTLATHRIHATTSVEAAAWEHYVHQKIISIPLIKNLRTHTQEEHKQSCARCRAKICGVRWERFALRYSSSQSGTVSPLHSSMSKAAFPASNLSSAPSNTLGHFSGGNASRFSAHPHAEPPIIDTSGIFNSLSSSISNNIFGNSSNNLNNNQNHHLAKHASSPTLYAEQSKITLHLCTLCFETLHSDVGSAPGYEKQVENQEFDDEYYRGSIWAKVRCLFGSVMQPLIETEGDPFSPLSSASTSDNSKSSKQGEQDPSEPRHIGSDQSHRTASTGTSSLITPYISSSSSNSSSDKDVTIKTTVVKLDDSNAELDEWLLMDPVPYFPSTSSSNSNDIPEDDASTGTNELLDDDFEVDSGSKAEAECTAAINFLREDNVLRPTPVRIALEPFMQAITEFESKKEEAFEPPPPIQATIKENLMEPDDPVFELDDEMKMAIANKKSRSAFYYGLPEDIPTKLPSKKPQGLDPLPPSSMLSGGSIRDTPPTSTPSYIMSPPTYSDIQSNRTDAAPPQYIPSYSELADPFQRNPDILVSASATIYANTPPAVAYATNGADPIIQNPIVSYVSPEGPAEYAPHPEPGDSSKHHDNAPYMVSSQEPIIDILDRESHPVVPTRDWNAEWQDLLAELRIQKLKGIYEVITTPEMQSAMSEEATMTTMLKDAGITEVEQIAEFLPFLGKMIAGTKSAPSEAPKPASLSRLSSSLMIQRDKFQEAIPPAPEYPNIESLRKTLDTMKNLSQDNSVSSEIILCIVKIKKFLQEFTEIAINIAKTIVLEVTLPYEAKTIKPRKLGGIAGGEKFLEQGIFFKFAIDAYGVYGGDKFALKAAGHELKGLRAYLDANIPEICVPLSTIIDYSGYRVVASAKLPISEQTLIYGSSDGGIRPQKSDPTFNTFMEEAAKDINIKAHYVTPEIELHSAVDLEGHKGTDGRYYVLDTARVFPPEPPLRTFVAVVLPADSTQNFKWAPSPPLSELELIAQRSKWEEQVRAYLKSASRTLEATSKSLLDGQVFYLKDSKRTLPLNTRASSLVKSQVRGPAIYVIEPGQRSTQLFNLLRPEYVSRQPFPLSSDAFTAFGRIGQEVHNTEVEDAFYRLLGVDIVNFAKAITSMEYFISSQEQLMKAIKSYGINMRLLGFVRSHLTGRTTAKALRSAILVEMVTRVAKNEVQAKLRNVRTNATRKDLCLTPKTIERHTHEILLHMFNLLLGNSVSSNYMWHSFMKPHLICKFGQYGQALTEAELDSTYDLRQEINKLQLFQSLQSKVGVLFKESVRIKFQDRPELFEVTAPFGPNDIEDLVARTKNICEDKLNASFMITARQLKHPVLRMEALRGFYGESSKELGYASLIFAHIMLDVRKLYDRIPMMMDTVFQVYGPTSADTPAEVTCKAFFLLGSASIGQGNLELAEGQLIASYTAYKRAIANHIGSTPMEAGRPFLLLVLDRLIHIMHLQQRKYEAWYYAHKFVRIWQSLPYPGDVHDLQYFFQRPIPLAFSVLWERDYELGIGYNGEIGAIPDSPDAPVVKSNLPEDDAQGLPELSPYVRYGLERDMLARNADAPGTMCWKTSMKLLDFASLSGFSLAPDVAIKWVKSGSWKKRRNFDAKTLRYARWSTGTAQLFAQKLPDGLTNKSTDDTTPRSISKSSIPVKQLSGGLSSSSTSQFSRDSSASISSGHSWSSLHTVPKEMGLINNIPPLQGTIHAPYQMWAKEKASYSFDWHIARVWLPEVSGGERFVLVKYEPSFWIVPQLIAEESESIHTSARDKIKMTGSNVGQYMHGLHEIVASISAPLVRTFGHATFENLNLPYGCYQVHLVSSDGRLWGKTTSKPGYFLSNITTVLPPSIAHHTIEWDEHARWVHNVFQTQGVSFTSIAQIALGSDNAVMFSTDSQGNLWYSYSELPFRVPEYLIRALPPESVQHSILNPLIPAFPSDVATTIQRYAASFPRDCSTTQRTAHTEGITPKPKISAQSAAWDDRFIRIHFDQRGNRIFNPGPTTSAVNSVLCTPEVEPQISSVFAWGRIRKVTALSSEKVVKVTASNTHVMALLENGDVYTWGNNTHGELGHGDLVRLEEPRIVKRLRGKPISDIFAGDSRSVVLVPSTRSLYQWGQDFHYFPEPHPFWKADDEVVKVVFANYQSKYVPQFFDSLSASNMPIIPREYDPFAAAPVDNSKPNQSLNPLWSSNPMLYLTDTGRVYLFGHDPKHHIFPADKSPILLDIFNNQPIVDAAFGINYFTVVTDTGKVLAAGENDCGQLGIGIRITFDTTCNQKQDDSYPSRKKHTKEAASKPSNGSTNNEVPTKAPAETADAPNESGKYSEKHTKRTSGGSWQMLGGTPNNSAPKNSEIESKSFSEPSDDSMAHAKLPQRTYTVSFPTKDVCITQIIARDTRVYAVDTAGKLWKWGDGIFTPQIFSQLDTTISRIFPTIRGACIHSGPHPPTIPKINDRGTARRRVLNLDKVPSYSVSAKRMLWTPNGLKPYIEDTPIQRNNRLVVVVDWERPEPMSLNGDCIKWVSPGSNYITDLPPEYSEISQPLPIKLASGRGQVVIDYMQPTITKCSVSEGMASGFLNKVYMPIASWLPISDDSKAALDKLAKIRSDRLLRNIANVLGKAQERVKTPEQLPSFQLHKPDRGLPHHSERTTYKNELNMSGTFLRDSPKLSRRDSGSMSYHWDGNAAIFESETGSDGATSSSSSNFMPVEDREFALQLPPGEYIPVYCQTRPEMKILAYGAKPVKFSYAGIKNSIEIDTSTSLGETIFNVTWKVELPMNGLRLVAREVNPDSALVASEPLLLRPTGSVKWRLPSPGKYRIMVEKVGINGIEVIVEGEEVEAQLSSTVSVSSYGKVSVLAAAINSLPTQAECKTWHEFFEMVSFTSEEIGQYEVLMKKSGIPVSFVSALDSGILDKVGITSLSHQIRILMQAKEQREATVKRILGQELQRICEGYNCPYDPSSMINSAFSQV